MKDKTIVDRIWAGLKRNPLKFVVNTFLAYTTLWTVLEPILGLIQPAQLYLVGSSRFVVLIVLSCTFGLYIIASPNSVELKAHNTTISIAFGDLFTYEGFKAIPVSRFFFETELIETSLQNIILRRFIASKEGEKGIQKYLQELKAGLKDKEYQRVSRGLAGSGESYYPLGTTALVGLEGEKYLLFALTETEAKGKIPVDNCTITKMWTALEAFWHEARIHARGKPINIPLIGGGVSGINISPSRLLELNLLAIENALVEEGKITTDVIRIVLHQKYFEEIDLSSIKAFWSN